MKTEVLHVQAALEQGLTLPFALVQSLSCVTLGKTPENVDTTELLEARFFDAKEEIRIFRRDDALCAVKLEEEPEDCPLEETYSLDNRRFGGSVTVRHTLRGDEDGQMFVSATRLCGWEGEKNHG